MSLIPFWSGINALLGAVSDAVVVVTQKAWTVHWSATPAAQATGIYRIEEIRPPRRRRVGVGVDGGAGRRLGRSRGRNPGLRREETEGKRQWQDRTLKPGRCGPLLTPARIAYKETAPRRGDGRLGGSPGPEHRETIAAGRIILPVVIRLTRAHIVAQLQRRGTARCAPPPESRAKAAPTRVSTPTAVARIKPAITTWHGRRRRGCDIGHLERPGRVVDFDQGKAVAFLTRQCGVGSGAVTREWMIEIIGRGLPVDSISGSWCLSSCVDDGDNPPVRAVRARCQTRHWDGSESEVRASRSSLGAFP